MNMKNILKTTISMVIAMVAVLGMTTISQAYSVGQELNIGYNDYIGNGNMYCLEHNQKLRARRQPYTVVSNVKIEGTKSTDHTGKTIDNTANAVFAYILNQNNGSNKTQGYVANAIWNYGYTWMQTVGVNHAGLYSGFASNKKGSNVNLAPAYNYANSITSGQSAKDNTNKNNVKVVAYNKDGKQYMRIGPFNWTFSGTLTDISIYDQNGKAISEKLYSSFNGTAENWFNASGVKSGSDFYISIPANGTVTKITKVTGKARTEVKTVNMWFLKAKKSAYQNLMVIEPGSGNQDIDLSFDYNISILGNLKVIKVNKDNTIVKLQGVGFYLQNKETGKYVKKAADGTISYVDSKDQATEFVTDKNGEFTVEKLIVGTYIAYETKNPNYGYEMIKNGVEQTIVVDKTTELQIPNKQIYVKLSGYIWVDKISGKQSLRNNLYKDNDYDSSDILLDGITVRLKDKSGNTIKEATTAKGGSYQFVDVSVDDLDNYHIEFEYDGLTYTNVIPHIDRDNGSKSAESTETRDAFNQNFAVVEGKTENTGITRDQNGNQKHELNYNIDKNEHTATLINNGQYKITANTNEAGYSIRAHFTYGQEEIKYINLGLYEREQPDIALVKDLQNVNVAINGYNHIYEYAQRTNNPSEYGGDGFNIGVKFGSKYSTTKPYSRAIYKADYEYVNENDKSKELQVYVTYKISMKNTSSNLKVVVNSIAEHYDSRYELVGAGTGLSKEGQITGNLQTGNTQNNGKYTKTIVNTGTRIENQQTESIYVQFKLNREAVLNILNDKANLDNVAEINSYSVYDENGKIYAGIDKNSNPGNVTPEDKQTYQDDTDSSPALKLEVADAREMSGKVFLDATSGELMTGKIRQGNGKYDDGEERIQDVKVTLKENTGSGKVYEATTNENGDYTISGFIPGDYTVIYTWGDKTYTVQNYKGTIYDSSRNQNDKEWYKKDVDNRLTDAIDNYETRQKIDEELKTQGYNTTTSIDKMDSTTPTMGIGVEYESTTTASAGNRYVYKISNVDFGIVERARQDLSLAKSVKSFKVTLANGQVIADAKIENGKLTGETKNVTYMKPGNNVIPKNGSIKLELDNELIQGATVEVEYEIKATNNSELDYLSENYYKYGKQEGKVITISAPGIIDYLDKNWAFDAEQNKQWTVKTINDIKEIVSEQVWNTNKNEENTIGDKTILYTESLKDKQIEPTKLESVRLTVSKKLANTDEVSLDNEAEITKIEKTGGSKTVSTPGNYVPGTGKTETDDSTAETVIVTPSTGANLNVILPVGIGIIALVVLGAGVVIIKKKAL